MNVIRLNIMLLICLAFFQKSQGQGISNIWILGYDSIQNQFTGRTVIDYAADSVTVSFNNQLHGNFLRTCSTISDSLGNLLFYTNGFDVFNRSGSVMPNGYYIDSSAEYDSFWHRVGMPITQGTLILPDPSSDSLYYLFHETMQPSFVDSTGTMVFYPKSLYFSVINMLSDSGMGDLSIREQDAFLDTLTLGRITAVKHANGRDWWIILYRYSGNTYIKLLLSTNGISPPSYQNIGPPLKYLDLAQAVFSPDGKMYAIADAFNGLILMNFDRCNGDFSNATQIVLNDTSFARGVAFSPNSRYLYVTGTKYLYQFDTWSSNITATKDTVAIWDGFYSPQFPFAASFYLMQLAPDGRIYVNAPNGVKVLHRIDYPDSAGNACSVCQHCVALATYNAFTIPNHPNYFLGADSGSVCDTLQLGIQNSEFRIQNETLSIFPNPANDLVQLSYTPNDKLRIIEIVAVDGRIVLRLNIPQWSQLQRIDVSKLNAGMYLCRFVGGKGGTVKFVVNIR
jgi:hypothetical protein